MRDALLRPRSLGAVYDPIQQKGRGTFGLLSARDRHAVLDAIKVQLTHQPTTETRNRKPMRSNPLAPWELRIGKLRVFYDVESGSNPVVNVLAIGVKIGNVIKFGKHEERL